MGAQSSKDKVKEISDILYKETILPAKEESEKIIEDAKDAAQKIIHNANEQAEKIHQENNQRMEDERKVHDSSIELAVKQSVATIKNEILNLFNNTFLEELSLKLNDQKMVEQLLKAVAEGVQKEGLQSDLKLFVSDKVNFDDLSNEIVSLVKGKLEKGEYSLPSGFALRIEDKKFTLKMGPKTCMKIVADNLSEALKGKVFS